MRPRPVVLLILDGWGVAAASPGNPFSTIFLPTYQSLLLDYPSMLLAASGAEVGSGRDVALSCTRAHEVIGAGRAIFAPYVAVDKALGEQRLAEQPVIIKALQQIREHHSALHLVILISTGGVQSHLDHFVAILEFARRENIERVYIHAILDSREVSTNSGVELLSRVQLKCKELRIGSLASTMGRNFGLDTRGNWSKVSRAYQAIIHGESTHAVRDIRRAVEAQNNAGISDEDIEPIVYKDSTGKSRVVARNDVVLFCNAEPDDQRHLLAACSDIHLKKFRHAVRRDVTFLTMWPVTGMPEVASVFSISDRRETLSECIADANLRQCLLAESERYPHLSLSTGAVDRLLKREDRFLLPSLPTEDRINNPEMRTTDFGEQLVRLVLGERYDFIMANSCAADIMAHTSDFAATVSSLQSIDSLLSKVKDAILAKDGVLMITADHGGVESIRDEHGAATQGGHSAHPVPFIIVANALQGKTAGVPDTPSSDFALAQPTGSLADIAPTVLKILELSIPKSMTGRSLL